MRTGPPGGCENQQLLIIYVFPGGGNFSRSELKKYSEEPDRTEQSQTQLIEHLLYLTRIEGTSSLTSQGRRPRCGGRRFRTLPLDSGSEGALFGQ